jgi:HEAT repeat protein
MTIDEAISLLGHWDASTRERAMAAVVAVGDAAVPALVAALDGEPSALRGQAALCLGQLGARSAILPLAEKAGSWPRGDERTYCVRALADIASAELRDDLAFGDLFAALLRDGDHFVRALAARALGKLGNPRARKLLSRATRDPETWVREAASWALSQIPADEVPSRASTTTLPAQARNERDTTPSGTDAIVTPTAPNTYAPAERSDETPADDAPKSAPSSGASVDEFLANLSLAVEEAPGAVTSAVDEAAQVVEEAKLVDAIERLSARSHTTRELAAEDLLAIGASGARHLSAALAENPAPSLEAVQVLGRIGDAEAVPVLEAIARRPGASTDLRAVAYRSLAALATGSERDVLDAILSEPSPLRAADPYVRAAAAAALGPFRSVRAARALLGLFGDPHALVREDAARALGRAAVQGVPDLADALRSAAKKERDENVLSAILETLTAAVRAGAVAAEAAARVALELLPRSTGALRITLVRLLADADRPGVEGADAVLASLSESDARLVEAACAVAGRVAPAGYTPLVERLTVLAGAADRAVSRAAILALGDVGGPIAAATLRQLRNDGDPDVAQTARDALAHLPTFDSEILPFRRDP